MKFNRELYSKAFTLILICSIASIVSILGGLIVPLVKGASTQVTISVGNMNGPTPSFDDIYFDVNINVTGTTIIGYGFDVYVNPAVLEIGYNYSGFFYDFYAGDNYFLYDWAETEGEVTVLIGGNRNVTAGTLIGNQEVVTGWMDWTTVKGASGTGLLAHLFFKPINTSVAYSPIVIRNAYYQTYDLSDPEPDSYPANVTMGHYGTPIHEVGVNSVQPSAPSVHRGDFVTLSAEAFNLGGYAEAFTVASYYNKTATTWEPILSTNTFTLDPLQTEEKSLSPIWDTERLEPGNYAIKANATVAGDTNAANNEATATIEVKPPLYDVAVTAMSVNLTSPFIGDIVEINVTAAVLNAHFLNGTVDPVNISVTVEYDGGPIGSDDATLVPEGETRDFTFYWDTAGVPASTPSNYTIEATVSLWTKTGWDDRIGFNDSNSTEVQVRILGDANSDGIVDIFDIGTISAHWCPGPPAGPQGYDALVDINHDGNIDISDIEILSGHMGETA